MLHINQHVHRGTVAAIADILARQPAQFRERNRLGKVTLLAMRTYVLVSSEYVSGNYHDGSLVGCNLLYHLQTKFCMRLTHRGPSPLPSHKERRVGTIINDEPKNTPRMNTYQLNSIMISSQILDVPSPRSRSRPLRRLRSRSRGILPRS